MIDEESRYRTSILYLDGTDEFIGVRPALDTTPQPDDIFHDVLEGERVDILAFRYYGRADLWWIICDYNTIFYPLGLEVGATLRLPSPEQVFMRILAG